MHCDEDEPETPKEVRMPEIFYRSLFNIWYLLVIFMIMLIENYNYLLSKKYMYI